MSSTGLKFTDLEALDSNSLSLSAIIPVVQDNKNFVTAVSSIASGNGYDDTLLQSTSGDWESTYTTVSANSASWIFNLYDTIEVTGNLSPDATGTYTAAGTFNGNPYYERSDGSFYIWQHVADWYISSGVQVSSTNDTWRSATPGSILEFNPIGSGGSSATGTAYTNGVIAGDSNAASWDSTYTTVINNSASWDNTQQTIVTSNSALDLDVGLGESALTTLTSHVTSFTISNAVSGESGMVIVSSDGGGWTFPADVYPSLVMAGDLADIATLTNSISSRITIGWYYDGEFNYLYVSNAIA